MKDKVILFKGSAGKGKSYNLSKYTFAIDSTVRDLVMLIKDYLYLSNEKDLLKNTLFFNQIIYPYVLHFYIENNRTATVKAVVDELKRIFPIVSDIVAKNGYAKVGEFLVSTVKNLFHDQRSGTGFSIFEDTKQFLYSYSPYCPTDGELAARMDDNDMIYENIGKGYEDFIIKTVKLTSEIGKGYSLFSSVDKFYTITENAPFLSPISQIAYDTLKETKAQFQMLEKDFILLNSSEYTYKVKLYLNYINACLTFKG